MSNKSSEDPVPNHKSVRFLIVEGHNVLNLWSRWDVRRGIGDGRKRVGSNEVRPLSSGIRPFGFLCFQNTKNPLKIQKTFETCNLETQVYFPEN